MPCHGPTAAEEAAMNRMDLASQRKTIDKLTKDLCEARGIIAAFASGAMSVDEFKMTQKWKKHLAEHLEHRRMDRDHAMDECMKKIKRARSTEGREKALAELAAVVAVEGDEELLKTELF